MDYLLHYGIKGQKHGVRRWQYQDGSLTPEGYPHYGYKGPRSRAKQKAYAKIEQLYDKASKTDGFKNSMNMYAQSNMEWSEGNIEQFKELYTDTDDDVADIDLFNSVRRGLNEKDDAELMKYNYKLHRNGEDRDYILSLRKYMPSFDDLLNNEDMQKSIELGQNFSKFYNAADDIYESMNRTDKMMLSRYGIDMEDAMLAVSKGAAFLEYEKDTPVSFLYLQDYNNVVIGTREGYRNKGYASKNVEKAKEWLENSGVKNASLEWESLEENKASQRLAEKSGFYRTEDFDGYNTVSYRYSGKK